MYLGFDEEFFFGLGTLCLISHNVDLNKIVPPTIPNISPRICYGKYLREANYYYGKEIHGSIEQSFSFFQFNGDETEIQHFISLRCVVFFYHSQSQNVY